MTVGRMMRRMHRSGRPQHHERQVRLDRLVARDPLDGAVGQVLVEMHRLAVRLGRVVVPHDGHELVHVGRHEGVGVLEALAARPAIERPNLRYLVQRRMVPLAERVVHVPHFLQVVRNRFGRLGHDRVVAGKTHRGQRMAAQTDRVRVAAGHQRGA